MVPTSQMGQYLKMARPMILSFCSSPAQRQRGAVRRRGGGGRREKGRGEEGEGVRWVRRGPWRGTFDEVERYQKEMRRRLRGEAREAVVVVEEVVEVVEEWMDA